MVETESDGTRVRAWERANANAPRVAPPWTPASGTAEVH